MMFRLRIIAVAAAAIVSFHVGLCSGSTQGSRYWSWGWGLYGLLAQSEPLDNARFDWTYVCFGNDAADDSTVRRCNEVLKLNPKHRFVLRVWPISNLGDCKENNFQATLFHYLYMPGIRQKVLNEVRRQIHVMLKGINKPENVVGATFLEELPGHFTSAPFGSQWATWKKGDALPWDILRFQEQIEAELGEPFDLRSERHRIWWGRKYVKVLGEIHQVMKEALGTRPVLYYQATQYSSLDQLADNKQSKLDSDPNLLPYHLREIVSPGKADGIFGYPNSALVWEQQTQRPVLTLNCLVFSQISVSPRMRLCPLPEMTALARWEYSGNLGSFLFPDSGRLNDVWKEPPHEVGMFWTTVNSIRRFAWENNVNIDIVRSGLPPVITTLYDLSNLPSMGLIHVSANVWNRREPSWFGGNYESSILKDVHIKFKIPDGLHMAADHQAGTTVLLGNLGPQSGEVVDWDVKLDRTGTNIPPIEPFKFIAEAEDGIQGEVSSSPFEQSVPTFESHVVRRSGERWLETAFRPGAKFSAVELSSLGPDIYWPSLKGDSQQTRVTYRDNLRVGTRLVIRPGRQAKLYVKELFSEYERHFYPNRTNYSGAVEFRKGYHVFAVTAPIVHSGDKYRISLNGWAMDGGNTMVVVQFKGMEAGRLEQKDNTVLINSFTNVPRTVESSEIIVPKFEGDQASVTIHFYRYKNTGVVYYKEFGFCQSDFPPGGVDVSEKMSGTLENPAGPFTVWTYEDLSDPGFSRMAENGDTISRPE